VWKPGTERKGGMLGWEKKGEYGESGWEQKRKEGR
jgi:hypothetical protein